MIANIIYGLSLKAVSGSTICKTLDISLIRSQEPFSVAQSELKPGSACTEQLKHSCAVRGDNRDTAGDQLL